MLSTVLSSRPRNLQDNANIARRSCRRARVTCMKRFVGLTLPGQRLLTGKHRSNVRVAKMRLATTISWEGIWPSIVCQPWSTWRSNQSRFTTKESCSNTGMRMTIMTRTMARMKPPRKRARRKWWSKSIRDHLASFWTPLSTASKRNQMSVLPITKTMLTFRMNLQNPDQRTRSPKRPAVIPELKHSSLPRIRLLRRTMWMWW